MLHVYVTCMYVCMCVYIYIYIYNLKYNFAVVETLRGRDGLPPTPTNVLDASKVGRAAGQPAALEDAHLGRFEVLHLHGLPRGCAFPLSGRNEKPNRTGRFEPNRTEPFNFGTGRNRTRNRTEPNRTEPRRVRKTQAEPRRTGESTFPNRTAPNR